MMIGQRRHPRAQLDAARALRDRCDEELGTSRRLPPAGMMLADPGFVVVELVQPLDELHIVLEGENRILFGWNVRRDEGAEA